MRFVKTWPVDVPLTEEQNIRLEELTSILTPEQGLWVSGYLAGLASGHGQIGDVPQNLSAQPMAAVNREEQAELTILYASETGNAQKVAVMAGAKADALGLRHKIVDVANFKSRALKDQHYLILITSTHGEGDPPEPAQSFNEFLFGRKAPKLEGTRFAVLGLGDSSYEHFCQTAVNFDERLASLGGRCIQPRAELDVEFETAAEEWLDVALTAFAKEMGPSHTDGGSTTVANYTPAPNAVAGKGPLGEQECVSHTVEVLEQFVLNGRGSDKTTYHLELSLEETGLIYAPGDAIGVEVSNDEEVVDEILSALNLEGETIIHSKGQDVSLRQALTYNLELTVSTPGFLKSYAELSEAPELKDLVAADNRSELFQYTKSRQIPDIVSAYPCPGIDGQQFVNLLRPLKPRLYSLASSLAYAPEEAHLTVGLVEFDGYQKVRRGVASGWIGKLRPGQDDVRVSISPNHDFHLPDNADAPIIMVGSGTGVAPYRAFMQEREACEVKAKSWLFFGDRRFRTDFLYQTEWQQFLKDEYLTRLDVAFSRDTARKVYVQHRMREQARELFDWLEQGAYFYVCGDASAMAPDVHQALIDVVQKGGGKSLEAATEYVTNLREEKRYRRDVY